jgi:hypothetical protein
MLYKYIEVSAKLRTIKTRYYSHALYDPQIYNENGVTHGV